MNDTGFGIKKILQDIQAESEQIITEVEKVMDSYHTFRRFHKSRRVWNDKKYTMLSLLKFGVKIFLNRSDLIYLGSLMINFIST